jgi:LCP family protein required for cell wall assembly
MRTTLKRGVGRGAASNGNGHTVLPPDALSAVSRYRQPQPPPRRRSALVGRILLWTLLVLVMAGGGLLGGAYLFFHESVAATRARSKDVKAAQRQLDSLPSPHHATIALLLGYDHRAGEEGDLPSRSDTLMLLRADPQTESVSMLSFPRDLLTEISCPGRAPVLDRINAAYAECGSVGTLETVKKLTGLPVNYLITVNFRGFKQIVNRLGGVWVDVDRRYYNRNTGTAATNYANINLMPGYQRVTGGAALDFVRYRHTDSDLYRLARQQMFVRALKEQLNHKLKPGLSLVHTLPSLVGAITNNVEVGVGGGGHYSGNTVLSYANFLYSLPAGHFFQSRIANVTGMNELQAPTSSIEQAVQDFLNPDVQVGRKATNVALGRKPKVPVLQPGDTTVTVLNGSGAVGAASNASYLLGQKGYDIVLPPSGKPANAPTWDYFRTKIYYERAKPGARVAARKLANLFGSADVGWIPPAIAPLSNGAAIVAVVGQTFHNTLGAAPVDRTPKASPALVQNADETTREDVLAAAQKLPFRLEVPSKVAQGSVRDSELPARTYAIAPGHKAVRLVFRTGLSEYWGIEQTDWTAAPVLGDRSFRHVIGGRPFDLYYSGPHLHMIVLRENHASYWVVNTLLDSISNETMIAIARGLRPLAE